MFFVQISDLLDALTLTLQESMAKTHPEITNLQLLSAVFHYMFFTLIDLWPFLLLPETSGRIPSHYSTFATPICLSQPLSGVACSNEWPWHHWSSTDWKWKDLGVSGTDAWALPGSICCCGCCMKFFFFFANLTGCTMDACFPHQVVVACNSQSNRFLFWRVSFLKKKSLSLHEYQIL